MPSSKTILTNYWSLVLESLKKSLSQSNFQAWFSQINFVETKNGGKLIVLAVPSVFNRNYIEKKFKKSLLESIRKYYPQVLHIEFKIDTENTLKTPNLNQESVFPISENELNDAKKINFTPIQLKPIIPAKSLHNLNPKYTLENLVSTKSNELAVSVAKAIVANPGTQYNPVFLYSGVGLGKTHLLQGIGNAILNQKPDLRIRYTTCETFFNLFISGIQNKKSSDFIDYYRSTDVLLIDDIQFISGKEATQEAFFHTFNELHQNNKQIVITSDRHPKDMNGVEDRLISRFEWGIVVDISKPELEDRILVLKDKIERLNLPLSLEQITIIASSINTNFRDMEGVLNRIQARINLLPNSPFENYELNKILSNSQKASPVQISINTNRLNCDIILDAVYQFFEVSRDELMGKSRVGHIALARQIAMYLVKEDLELSYPAIAKIFGKDHSTILHGYKKIQDNLKTNSKLISKIEGVRKIYR